jgi:hypothetical protein
VDIERAIAENRAKSRGTLGGGVIYIEDIHLMASDAATRNLHSLCDYHHPRMPDGMFVFSVAVRPIDGGCGSSGATFSGSDSDSRSAFTRHGRHPTVEQRVMDRLSEAWGLSLSTVQLQAIISRIGDHLLLVQPEAVSPCPPLVTVV